MKFFNWISLIFLFFAFIILWTLKEILIQIFASIVLALLFCSIIGAIKNKLKIPRTAAFLLTISGIILFFTLTTILIVPQFSNEFQQLLNQLPSAAIALWNLIDKYLNELSFLVYGKNTGSFIEKSVLEELFLSIPDGATIANGITESIRNLLSFAGDLGVGFLQLLFILSVSLMISAQPNSYIEVFILLVPSFYRRRARLILKTCGDDLTHWMLGVLISSTFVAILAAIGLYLLGVKLVIANALIAGFLNIIPNVGPTISTIFPMSMALLDAPWKSIAVLGTYIFIQNLESYIITPSIMQKQVRLLPGLALTAQFVFTIIFGPIGLIMALPLAVVVQIIGREILVKDILERRIKKN